MWFFRNSDVLVTGAANCCGQVPTFSTCHRPYRMPTSAWKKRHRCRNLSTNGVYLTTTKNKYSTLATPNAASYDTWNGSDSDQLTRTGSKEPGMNRASGFRRMASGQPSSALTERPYLESGQLVRGFSQQIELLQFINHSDLIRFEAQYCLFFVPYLHWIQNSSVMN